MIRGYYYDMPDINGFIASRQLQFIGKKMRGPSDHPVTRLLIASVDAPRPRGRPPTSTKHTFVRNLQLMLPEAMQTGFKTVKNHKTGEEKEVPVYDMTGQLHRWLPIALDKAMWNYHIDLLKYPTRDIPQPQPQHQDPSTSPRANRKSTTE